MGESLEDLNFFVVWNKVGMFLFLAVYGSENKK